MNTTLQDPNQVGPSQPPTTTPETTIQEELS
jgi:hypothetical protein